MAQSESSLAVVAECRKKSYEFYKDSLDGFFAMTTRGFESVEVLLSETSDRNHIQRALISLDAERKLSMQFEDPNPDPARIVTYGFIESAQLAFHHLIGKIESLQAQIDGRHLKSGVEKHAQTDEHQSYNENANEIGDFPRSVANSMDGLSTVPTFTPTFPMETKKEIVESKEEPIDTTQTIPEDKQNSTDHDGTLTKDISINDEPALNMGGLDGADQMVKHGGDSMTDDLNEKAEKRDHNSDIPKDSSYSVEVEKRRSSSRFLAGGPMEDSDGVVEPSAKKSRSEKRGDKTTPQCVLCEVFPTTPNEYVEHLRADHKSTLTENGIYLTCCGHDVHSLNHNSRRRHTEGCDRSQFTLHKLEEKKTPQCILCEAYPSTPNGYSQHLHKDHKSTLRKSGIYLICECGYEVRHYENGIHLKECHRSEFTLHKLDEN